MGLDDRQPPTAGDYLAYRTELSNWGRWGEDDQLGTLNFITQEKRRESSSLVSEGRVVSLSYPIATSPGPLNPRPAWHLMRITEVVATDFLGIDYHGLATTHIDGLSHIFTSDGQMYNGRSASEVTPFGARKNGIEAWRDGIVTRGVLYDIPSLRQERYVGRGEPVYGWELEDAADRQGVTPLPGDAVLVRSGRTAFFEDHPPEIGVSPDLPGLDISVLEFLHRRDAALLGWDLMENHRHPYPAQFPVHELAVPYMGLALLDNCDLEAVVAACAELGRWEFQLVVAPLVVPGGTGSPANPLAIF